MTVETVIVEGGGEPIRLDRWFKRHYPALGHVRLEKLLRTGQIRVDGRRARASDRVAPGQAIRIPPLGEIPPAPRPRVIRPPTPEDAAILERAILHRDDALIVLDKPPGLAVQGGTETERHLDALLDALRFGSAERPRLVHRLDKDTSGVLVVARTAAAAAFLARAFRDKRTRKIYWAVVVGVPQLRQGKIDLALAKTPGRHGGERVHPAPREGTPRDRRSRGDPASAARGPRDADAEAGRRAVTYYRVVDTVGARASFVALLPITGRTHQLRAHCAAIGAPILGDGKYGG
ncbi:MAG TPA: RluA family pseudouridine synthase, partial [Stellaceae bacterium]|nr:RluA family pseudouridine synthase [Stellaceae bacterium]